ncbi:hypothetical protein GCM10023219_10030 [Stakelama sediminis]|uniref:PAT family beta-lactamase induction signal transducer AmpG n=1 Tax=Stakelama sediminis TaxID=463200 RepID=A0A840YW01_9SPHN|nr:MFS transporter [Stakelama sediminis]MBB5717726.1 PAT family beta-lactamase induction signal transducer AmpG [Stakelama sediminis]
MPSTKSLPPIWFIGLAVLPFGMFGALTLITVPQLLEARHVPETVIAGITSFAMIPGFTCFLLAPILDVHFSRRSYALVLGVAAAILGFVALEHLTDIKLLSTLLFLGFFCSQMFVTALGGWFGSIVPDDLSSPLGAWFAVGNTGGFGVGAITIITLLRVLPGTLGHVLIALLLIAPLAMLPFIPAPQNDRMLLHESFRTLFRDLVALVKQRIVLRTLFLFCLPAASFALTNTLGGLGDDFHASETFVATLSGTAVLAASVFGNLIVPKITRYISARLLYLTIGSVGALFTLSLIGMPRVPLVYAIALIGQNVFQSAAFTVENTIVFQSIGEGNPLASTQFAFLGAAAALPIVYMQAVDGHAYGMGGMTGTFAADALISLAACTLLLPFVLHWRRKKALTA